MLCLCPPSHARPFSLGGKGNALYLVLFSFVVCGGLFDCVTDASYTLYLEPFASFVRILLTSCGQDAGD